MKYVINKCRLNQGHKHNIFGRNVFAFTICHLSWVCVKFSFSSVLHCWRIVVDACVTAALTIRHMFLFLLKWAVDCIPSSELNEVSPLCWGAVTRSFGSPNFPWSPRHKWCAHRIWGFVVPQSTIISPASSLNVRSYGVLAKLTENLNAKKK